MGEAGIALLRLCACLAGLVMALEAHAQSAAGTGLEQAGYTCCNFHNDGNRISDANWIIYPTIPAGTAARVLGYGEHQVSVEIGGRAMVLGLDYGRQQNLREWAQRMIVPRNPKERIAAWPPAAREAIDAGRIALGMTKEQVIVAVGYPPAHATPSMDAPRWKYWFDTHGTYEVVWDDAGRVTNVAAAPPIRFRMLAAEPVEGPPSSTGGPVQLKDLEGLLPGADGARK